MTLAAIPAIAALVPSILNAVEMIFGPKTGKVKKETATKAIMPIIEQAAAAGKLSGIPEAEDIGELIETILANMRRDGTLKDESDPPPARASARRLTLPTGTKLTITLESSIDLAL